MMRRKRARSGLAGRALLLGAAAGLAIMALPPSLGVAVAAEEAKPAAATPAAKSEPRGSERYAAVRRAYAEAVGVKLPKRDRGEKYTPGLERAPGGTAVVLESKDVPELIERGWRGRGMLGTTASEQSARIRTYVGVARALGLPGSAGAMQASFGTPHETGVAALDEDAERARAALKARPKDGRFAASLRQEEARLDEALAKLPGSGRKAWATANLDLNRDGVIDKLDLEAAKVREAKSPAKATREAKARGKTAETISLGLDEE